MQAITPPDLPRLIVNSSGSYKYVYTYKNHWDKTLQRAVRSKGDSKCVGKFIPVEGEEGLGEIHFNKEFIEEYPELEHLRVFRRKGGKLEFRPVDDELYNVIKSNKIIRLHGGATYAMNQIVAASPIGRALKEAFPERKLYAKLLSLAYFLTLRHDGSMCNYEEFAECTWLPYQRALYGSSIGRLLRNNITRARVMKFLQLLQREYQKDVKRSENITEPTFWALDSTSITSYSENISSVNWGHNKDQVKAPQTNVLLIVDQKTGIPVYYRNYDGNVPDVSTVRNTIAELGMAGIDMSNVVLVTDRGYGSQKNYEDLLRNGVSFINNVRLGRNAAICKLIDDHYQELLDWNNSLPFIRQNAVTVPMDWYYDEFPVENKRSRKSEKKTVYCHIYLKPSLRDDVTENLRSLLTDYANRYNKDPDSIPADCLSTIDAYMVRDSESGKVRIDMKKVDDHLHHAGVRVLISDSISDATECLCAYEGRNRVEEAFNMIKSRLNCNRTLTHSSESWDAKLFLEVIASAIGLMVRARIKSHNEQARGDKKLHVHYDSDGKLLAKLNNVWLTKYGDGWIFDEIAGKTTELFQILGVPVPSAETRVGHDDGADDEEAPLEYEEEKIPNFEEDDL